MRWYVQRLLKMSPTEMAWRGSDQARKWAWARQQVRLSAGSTVDGTVVVPSRTAPRPLPQRRFRAVLPDGGIGHVPVEARAKTMAAADELLEGRWEVLGVTREDMEDPDWFFDPVTGRRAPQGEYCFGVDYRDEEVAGNIKQVWELSRMHHVTVLAAAFAFSGDERYAERVSAHLRSWWRENPFLSGVHWTSGIEAGIRLTSWVWARRLLDNWSGAPGLFEENQAALAQIWWHQRYLAGFRSRGSSANNHVIAEAAGQLIGALAFDWFPESEKWSARAAEVLQDELAKNTFPSGVNREMAFDYHGLVAELGLVAGAEADLAGRSLDEGTWSLLQRMVDVVAATVDEKLQAPRYGDGDDGRALVLDPGANRWESLLGTGRALFGAPDWWPSTQADAASTLVAAMASRRPQRDRPTARPPHFADAGLTVLRSSATHGPEIWCRCDAGPHGFLSIAAHGHADALSVEVRHGGIELLADPGTYCYHGEPRWRTYFRSTLGHNTLELEGEDQSASGGPFLWARHAQSRLLELKPGGGGEASVWSAEHDGYKSLDPPATHRRTVRLFSRERRLEITDEVATACERRFRLVYHLGPTVMAALIGNSVELSWEGPGHRRVTAVMNLAPEAQWRLARGESDPVLGWYAPRFGCKQAAFAVLGEGTCDGRTKLVTVLQFAPPA